MRYCVLFILLTGCAVAPRVEDSPYLIPVSTTHTPTLSPPTVAPVPQQSLQEEYLKGKEFSVFIDAGHGGEDRGTACKFRKLQEKSLTLETARRVERLLMEKGYRVFMSRRRDITVPLLDRVQIASKKQPNIFVSIHFNFTKNTVIQGAEVFYFQNPKQPVRTKLSRSLGHAILKQLTESLPTPSRGVKSGNFCVIRETSMPSVLVESAFLSNPHDARLLTELKYRQKIARAIADGIDDYFHNEGKSKERPRRESNARPVA